MKLTRSGRETPSSRIGPPRLLITLGAAVLLLTAVLAVLPSLLRPGAMTTASDDATAAAESAAARLGSRLDEQLALLARLPDEAVARSTFPDAIRVRDLPSAGLEAAPQAEPPVGYALVAQVRRALDQSQASAEVYRPNRPGAQLNLVTPIAEGARLVTLPPQRLTEWLGETRPTFSLALEQDGTPVLSRGRADGPAGSAEVHASPWRITVQAPTPTLLVELPTLWLVALGLAGLALVALGAQRLRTAEAAATPAVGDTPPAPAATDPPMAEAADDGVSDTSDTPATNSAPETGDTLMSDADPSRPGELPPLEFTDPAGKPAPAPDAAIPDAILRAYDIRGIVGETLTPAIVRLLGQAIGSRAGEAGHDTVVTARDGRHSSPALAQALIEGLTASGRDVIDIGEAPTPLLYFATHELDTGAGVMVTGSHNPPDHNGLKIVLGGEALCGEAIRALGKRVRDGALSHGEGRVSHRDLIRDYTHRVTADITLHRPLRVVVDCGNGVAGAVAPALFRALDCEVTELFCDVDGDFPHHHPDPTVPENLEALIRTVTAEGADIGLAFDGDGDRLGVVDNEGRIIWPDRQLMLFAREVLSRAPGSDVIFDVKCTRLLPELITAHAGVPVMWRSGHSPLKQRRAQTNAPLAGEMSGHIVFADRWYGFDDGLYAGARLLELLSFEPALTSAALFATLPEATNTPEIRLDLAEGESEAVMERLLAHTGDLPDAARVTTLDGLRVDFSDSWGLVRASNTQPCLVLRFEGDDEAALERIRARFRGLLAAAAPHIELPF